MVVVMAGKNKNRNNAVAAQATKQQLANLEKKVANQRAQLSGMMAGKAKQMKILPGTMPAASAEPRGAEEGELLPFDLDARESRALWQSLGDTDSGRDWAMNAVHPNHAENQAPMGIPDATMSSVVTPRYRGATTITYPGTAVAGGVWDLEIAILPICEIDYVWRSRLGSSDPWSIWNVVYNTGFSQSADGTASGADALGIGKLRCQARGVTMYFDAAGLTNQGMVYAGQIEGTKGAAESVGIALELDANDEPVLPRFTGYYIPTSTEELMQLDPSSVEWQAVHGVYMPIRFSETVTLYGGGADGGVTRGLTPDPSLLPNSIAVITSGAAGGDQRVTLPNPPTFVLPDGVPFVLNEIIYGVSDAFQMLTGVVFFSGIAQSSTVALKSRMSIEGKLSAGELVLQPYVHPPPVLDRRAMDAVSTIGQQQPHAYPSSYNDFSKLMRTVFNTLFHGVRYVGADLLGKVPFLGGALSQAVSGIRSPVSGSTYF